MPEMEKDESQGTNEVSGCVPFEQPAKRITVINVDNAEAFLKGFPEKPKTIFPLLPVRRLYVQPLPLSFPCHFVV